MSVLNFEVSCLNQASDLPEVLALEMNKKNMKSSVYITQIKKTVINFENVKIK